MAEMMSLVIQQGDESLLPDFRCLLSHEEKADYSSDMLCVVKKGDKLRQRFTIFLLVTHVKCTLIEG